MKKPKFHWSGWLLFFFLISAWAASPVQPLAVDQAFPLKIWSPDSQTVVVQWDIQPGYYLYKDRIQIGLAENSPGKLGAPRFPASVEHENPVLGRFAAYDSLVQTPIPVLSAPATKLTLQVNYQGCSKQGYCYPPQTRQLSVGLGRVKASGSSVLAIDAIPSSAEAPVSAPVQALLQHRYQWAVWLGFFGLGLLISLTPCVLPMIPVLSAMILGKTNISHARAFCISLAYVLGMALTYALAGVLFGVLGGTVQAFLQKPWIIVVFSAIFVAMALSLWGAYYLEPPEKWRAWVARFSERQRRGSLPGAVVMGGLSALILSPCATPPLIAVLTFIGQTGNALLGGLALFVVGLGSGVPLLLIGAFGRRLLPRSGAWMQVVKNILGVMMIGMAIWMLGRILPERIIWVLWGCLAIGVAVYLKTFGRAVNVGQVILKILGILIFIVGILLFSAAWRDASSPWKPWVRTQSASQTKLAFIPVKNLADVREQMDRATGRPVILDFYADWCVSCKLMEKRVFAKPDIQSQLNNFLLLRADITENNDNDQALMRYYRVIAPPTLIFFDRRHQEVSASRVVGEISPAEFMQRLKTIEEPAD
jgi:thioredoxin:protein disulfide reductase